MRFVAGLLILISSPLRAYACTSPVAGVAGEMKYISGTMRFCDGTNWVTMNSTNTAVACTSAGEVRFQNSRVEYCNGTNWLLTAPNTNYGACVAGDAGRMYYDTTGKYYWFCTGSYWRRMGP